MIVPFDELAKLAGTRRVRSVAIWCARNRINTFRDTKNRPCTTIQALDSALNRGKDEENTPNYDPPPPKNGPAKQRD